MEKLSLHSFHKELAAYDKAVGQTPYIDRFCSSSYWVLPAHHALNGEEPAYVWRADSSNGYVALARGRHESVGNYLQPLEASWGLASPIVGSDVRSVAREFASEFLHSTHDWETLFLTGIHKSSPQFVELVQNFRRRYFVGLGPSMTRMSARLDGGLDGFLERRSSKFRANLRNARRDAEDVGVTYEYHSELDGKVDQIFDRIIDIERRSWKGKQDSGISSGRMRHFYERMTERLVEREALRVGFARADAEDIAYCFGGVFDFVYRGLQMSYDDEYSDLSIGNLLQVEMIRSLVEEGVETYDMGQAMDYKSRWTDDEFTTVALVIRK
jgi:hypothetical protein